MQSTTGFYANTVAQHLFIALWEYLSEKKNVVPDVDSQHWKMKFVLDEPLCEPIELEEDEEEIPTRQVEIVAKVQDRGATVKPRYYMDFRRKSGDAGLFSRFVRNVMKEKLSMFCEKV